MLVFERGAELLQARGSDERVADAQTGVLPKEKKGDLQPSAMRRSDQG